MNESTLNGSIKQGLVCLFVVMCCTAMSFGISNFFPQAERWFAHWQFSLVSPPESVSSPIVLVRTEGKSPAHCGQGKWKLHALEAMLFALHQAGASGIAPVINASGPISSECGGLSGLVNLAEVTKHVGSVVYPSSVPPILAQAAFRTGTLEMDSNDEEMGIDFQFHSSSLHAPELPFGAAVAELIPTIELAPTLEAFLVLPRLFPKSEESLFQTYSFSEVWSLMQTGEEKKLTDLFKGKVVFIVSGSSESQVLSPQLESHVSIALLHARLANALLNPSWKSLPPFGVGLLMAVVLNGLPIALLFRERSLKSFMLMGLAVVCGVGSLLVLGFYLGWILPLFSMGLAVGMTIIVAGAWGLWQSRETIQQQIVHGEHQLTHLEQELFCREHHARQLEEQLSEAQSQSHQSGSMIEKLQNAQHTSLVQLNRYQNEVQETRQKIESLQEELQNLRQCVPVPPEATSVKLQPDDDQELIQECKALNIVTRDPSVLELFQNLKKAAATQVPILLLGETGTGKEVFAQAAHALSPRRQGPFISVNMAAIRSELFEGELFGHVKGAFTGAVGRTGFLESAQGGTLFLDEVGELPLDLQVKLLRFLEDGGFHRVGQSCLTHVDARIIAATNRDLQQEVQAGRYREDLYYRLRGMVMTLPPLRLRSPDDRVLLAQSFLQQCVPVQHRTDVTFTQGALDAIVAYTWPGNIRELRQTITQAVALASGPIISEGDLHLEGHQASQVRECWGTEDFGGQEDAMVLECLRRHKFEMQATAATLGWDRGTVTQRLKGLGFQALMKYQGNIQEAAKALAGDEKFVRVVEGRLREYANNLIPASKNYQSVEEAIADCRKRFRNLPDRHFPAVEQLIHARFATLYP